MASTKKWEERGGEGRGGEKSKEGKRNRGVLFYSLPNLLSLSPPFLSSFDACHAGYYKPAN